MQSWIALVLFYGIAKGFREALKKKALEKNSVAEVLFFYTAIAFLFTIPFSLDAFNMPLKFQPFIIAKSVCIFVAWICAFSALKKIPVSFYGVMDMSRALFATLMGIIVLGETMTVPNIIGFFVVAAGLGLVNVNKNGNGEKVKLVFIIMVLLSCFLNAVSGTLDKMIMKSGGCTPSQLQFFFMLYLTLLYFIYMICFSRPTVKSMKSLSKNWWIVLLAALFVFADRLFFIANADPRSKVVVMTLLKQSAVFVTILLGKFLYKEKNISYRVFCAALVAAGMIISVF